MPAHPTPIRLLGVVAPAFALCVPTVTLAQYASSLGLQFNNPISASISNMIVGNAIITATKRDLGLAPRAQGGGTRAAPAAASGGGTPTFRPGRRAILDQFGPNNKQQAAKLLLLPAFARLREPRVDLRDGLAAGSSRATVIPWVRALMVRRAGRVAGAAEGLRPAECAPP